MSEQQTYDVLELIAKHNAFDKILVGMVLRYAPLYKDLVAALSSKLLGEITSIEASEHIPLSMVRFLCEIGADIKGYRAASY